MTQGTIDFTGNNEQWKDVEGYEGFYKVSNIGKIKRIETLVNHPKGGFRLCKSRILKGNSSSGYEMVELSMRNKKQMVLVHRIVASAFIINTENKPCVNHIDGNKSNNDVLNLEWCTYSENESHKIHSLNKKPSISNFKKVQQTDIVVRINDKNIYGIELQDVLKRLMSGEIITPKGLSEAKKTSLHKSVYHLRSRYKVPIVSQRSGIGRFTNYFL